MVSEPQFFSTLVSPDWEALVQCIGRAGTPNRVHFIELFLDAEIQTAICEQFRLLDGLTVDDAFLDLKRQVIIQRFLGYDFVRCGLEGFEMPLARMAIEDTSALERDGGRAFMEEHRGPITNWAEFEAYPWPDMSLASARSLDWYEANLPDDMCVIASRGLAHFAEYLTWLMGYEMLCYSLYDQRDLVMAISKRLIEMFETALKRMLKYERVKIVWGGDHMGSKSGTLISPADLREFVLPGHKLMAEMS